MSVPGLVWADQAAVAPPHDPAMSCEGVEKMAAQKELLSAKAAIDKGDMAGCKTHVNNAMGAMMAHNPG
jgi:hypothetical protein